MTNGVQNEMGPPGWYECWCCIWVAYTSKVR